MGMKGLMSCVALLLLWGLCSAGPAGREFATAFMENYRADYGEARFLIQVSAPLTLKGTTEVRVTVPQLAYDEKRTVKPGEGVTFQLPASVEMTGSGKSGKTVRIEATQEVTVMSLNYKPYTADTSVVYPVAEWGTEYYVYTPNSSPIGTYHEFSITNHKGPNSVEVYVKDHTQFKGRVYPAGSTIPFELGPFESVQIQSLSDLTGSRVLSKLPVAVSTGHSCTWKFSRCNHVYEQLLPVSGWGKSFIVAPLDFRNPEDRYDSVVIQASEPTHVTVREGDSSKPVTMKRGDTVQYRSRWPAAFHITADKGIQVLFEFNGAVAERRLLFWLDELYDPFLMTVLPTERFSTAYTLEGQVGFNNLAMVVARTKDLAGLTFDRTPFPKSLQWRAMAGSEYSWAQMPYPKGAGLHRAAHLSSPFGLYSMGFAQKNGYGSPAISNPVDCSMVKCEPSEDCQMKGDTPTCVKKPPAPKMGTCWAMGDPHYRTFDGRYFNFMGNCTYTMAKSCHADKNQPAFEVEAKNSHPGNSPVTSVSKVIVKVYGYVISIDRDNIGLVRVNYEDWSLPINLDKGKVVMSQSGLSMLLETDFGLTVQYDWAQYLVVTVPGGYAGKVCGFCGNFNGRQDDDLATPVGSQATDAVALGKSWRVQGAAAVAAAAGGGGDYSSCRDECTGKCADCKSSYLKRMEAEAFCEILSLLMDGPFRSCHAVMEPKIFHDMCMYDFCMGGGMKEYLCDSLQVYTDACQRAGVKVYDWRKLAGCPNPKCPENSRYEPCGQACPATCEDPEAPTKCKSHCVETCTCNPGYLLSGNQCVPSSRCGCTYEGRYSQPDKPFWGDNNCTKRCHCNPTGGNAECTSNTVCPSGTQCTVVKGIRDCHPQPLVQATCMATGDPHFLTFDGRRFNFEGTCVYQMAGVCSKKPGLEPFDVLVQNDVRNNRVGSVAKLVEVKVYGYSIVISKQYHRNIVMINGEIVNLPGSLPDKKALVYKSGLFAVVETNFGVSVSFDWDSTVIVKVPKTYEGVTCGLCGNYNHKAQDDMRMKDGKEASSPKALGQSWRVAEIPGCVDGCRGPCPDCDVTQMKTYESLCAPLIDPNGPFKKCHPLWDPKDVYQDCLYDVCLYKGRDSRQCPAFAAYTAICQTVGATVEKWRNSTFCSYPCLGHSHYEVCAKGCSANCATLAPPTGCKSQCQEGCLCDEGYILSGHDCVPLKECGCQYHERYYKLKEAFYTTNCEKQCTCMKDGKVECKKIPCGADEKCEVKKGAWGCHSLGNAKCTIRGDPHYRTFDNRTYDFQGTCTYIAAGSAHLDRTSLTPFSVVVENERWYDVADTNATSATNKVSVAKLVTVEAYGFTLILRKNQIGMIMMNGVMYNLPLTLNDGAVEAYQHGTYDVIKTDFGLVVTYDLVYSVTITVPGSYRGKTAGLCGNFNGNKDDDDLLPDGAVAKSVEAFGAAWKVGVPGVVCDDGCSGDVCPRCGGKKRAVFEKDCARIREESGPFHACHAVLDPSSYYRDCVYDVCVSDGNRQALCASVQAYMSDCQNMGVVVKPWRSATFCPLSCPAKSHYKICAETCANPCPGLTDTITCPTTCAEGCACDDNYYFNGTSCVEWDRCSCYWKGQTYKIGETIVQDSCRTKCTCQSNGQVVCDQMSCKSDERCLVKNGVRGCFPKQCMLQTASHFTMFSGIGGTISAAGAYELVAVCGPGLTEAEWFRVVVDFRVCEDSGHPSVVSVYVFFQDLFVLVNKNHQIWVNGKKAALPKTLKNEISVKVSDEVVVIEKKSGLRLTYNVKQEVSVTVDAHLADKLCGACGTFTEETVLFASFSQPTIQAHMNRYRAPDFSSW
ncbi:hypothetical protein SKAU_G00407040 [Synaphobranchus kaupii]|uniref:VWFD domain-containing protein n=1 Tax=Synaphobranchus kaupii TaxID=118154 RepID=A0A9Q1EA59_SYNKA|nr:hypothetical protein SKAU_G00407040 [Synaphobranchus kaupii]